MEKNLAVDLTTKTNLHEFSEQHSFSKAELISCGHGKLFGAGNAVLPLPPLLMFDRVSDIQSTGGNFDRGLISAELDINPFLWFFKSHFQDDPLMPGCLAMEGLWQLTGFYLGWSGYKGRGRVIDSGNTRFSREITPANSSVRFDVHIKRIFHCGHVIAVADGTLVVDGEVASHTKAMKIGLVS